MRRYIGALVVVGASALLAGAGLLIFMQFRSTEEQKAIDAIKKLGGRVTVDDDPTRTDKDAPDVPAVAVSDFYNRVTDADLKELVALKDFQTLSLADLRVTDGYGHHVARLPLTLSLAGTQVTDAGLKELAVLNNLQWLDLMATWVTDAGLKELAALKGLQKLNLTNCPGVTDAGLKELAALKKLRALGLCGTKVTDAGLKELAALKGLRTLDLRECNGVTDAGVADLEKALPNLKIIHPLQMQIFHF